MDIDNFVSQALEQLGAAVAKAHGKPGITISPRPYLRDDTSNTAGDGSSIAVRDFSLACAGADRV